MSNDDPPLVTPAASVHPSPGLGRARAVALEELRRKPRVVSWRRDALTAVLLLLAASAMVLGVGAWVSIVEVHRLQGRWLPLVLLVAVQVVGVIAALAPGRRSMRWSAAALALAAAITLPLGRGAGAASAMPGFACSTSHLAVDLVPLALVLYFVRKFSVTTGRALLAGVAAAATGAMAGELSCGRGWSHVLVHHIGAAVAIAVACVLLARAWSPRTYAP
jgi:hypothetical protein